MLTDSFSYLAAFVLKTLFRYLIIYVIYVIIYVIKNRYNIIYTASTRKAQENTLYVKIHSYIESFQVESVVTMLLWNLSTYPEYTKCYLGQV